MSKFSFNTVVDTDGTPLNGINFNFGYGKILTAIINDNVLLLIADADKHTMGQTTDVDVDEMIKCKRSPFIMLTFDSSESIDILLSNLSKIKEKNKQNDERDKLKHEIEKLYAERNSLEKKMTELNKEIEEKTIELYHEKKYFTKNSTPCSEI